MYYAVNLIMMMMMMRMMVTKWKIQNLKRTRLTADLARYISQHVFWVMRDYD